VLVGAPGHLDDADAWQREWLPVIAEMVTRADLWLRTNGYIVLIALGAASMLLTHGVPLLARYVKVKRNPALHIAWNNAFNRPDIKAENAPQVHEQLPQWCAGKCLATGAQSR
jgi:hypothetical protein